MDVRNRLFSTLSVISKHMLQIQRNLQNNSSSDEEDDFILITHFDFTRRIPATRIENYLESVVFNYTNVQFKMHFRLTRHAFENVLSIIGPQLRTQHREGRPRIEPRIQLLAVIWLLATPDSYRSVGDRFNLSKSSLYHCFIRVIHVLNDVAPNVIKWPDEDYIIEVKRGFSGAGIANIVGAVDGCYIQIKAPKDFPEVYICRKKFHAITLQAICDHKLKFTDCYVGYPSSVNDYRIFKNSDIYKKIIRNPFNYFPQNEFIIGDKAYPVRQWCLTPYINRGNLTGRQRQFNEVLSSERQKIERSFALLKGRFRRLKYLDMTRTDLIPATILACCVLHNICINNGDLDQDYINENIENVQNIEDENFQQGIMYFDEDEAGILRRDRIAMNL